jgi:hypothetical protein
VHNKTELILENGQQKQHPSKINQERKEVLHKLCVEAVIRDSLSFNAFEKPGLSKLIKEAVPGKIRIFIACFPYEKNTPMFKYEINLHEGCLIL